MLPTNEGVRLAASRLKSEAWLNRDSDPGGLQRADEIFRLVEDQLRDDTYTVSGNHRDRIGDARTGWVMHYDTTPEDGSLLWPSRTEPQIALEIGLQPFLDQLPGDERALVRWRYYQRLTIREIANMTSGGHTATVQRRLKGLHVRLRDALLAAYPLQSQPEETTTHAE